MADITIQPAPNSKDSHLGEVSAEVTESAHVSIFQENETEGPWHVPHLWLTCEQFAELTLALLKSSPALRAAFNGRLSS
jgi:hypothetical protein